MARREALEKMRDMWMWIAEETEKKRIKIGKFEFFKTMNIMCEDIPKYMCYACEYAERQEADGRICPIESWNTEKQDCLSGYRKKKSPYRKWDTSKDWKAVAKYASEIAALAREELDKLEGVEQ